MKKLNHILKTALPTLAMAADLAAVALCGGGCNTPVDIQGGYSTPAQTITGGVQTTTNAVTVGGAYQTGTTNVGGSITITK